MIPKSASAPGASVLEIEAVGGRAFETSFGDARDILLMADGALAESAQVASDFEWAWARYEAGRQTPSEVLLINGRSLFLDGRKVLDATNPIAYLFMRRIGEDLYVEAESKPELSGAALGAARVVFTSEMPGPEASRQLEEAGKSF
jgi:hypothetical protein